MIVEPYVFLLLVIDQKMLQGQFALDCRRKLPADS